MNDETTYTSLWAASAQPLRSKVAGVYEHGARFKLHNELHVGPCELLSAPTRVSHLALFSNGSNVAEEERRLIAQLCDRYGVSPPAADANHFSAMFGSFRLKWDRHTECAMYTFFQEGAFDQPFAEPVIDLVPKEWLASLPGEVIAAAHIAIDHAERPQRSLEELARLFASNTVMGAKVAAGSAVVWTDNKIHADGFARILVHDIDLRRRQAGRLVHRLLEIETYRMLAMLPVPLARQYIPKLAQFDERLAELTAKNSALETLEDEQQLLSQLTELAAEIESISAATNHRFSATLAYYNIVRLRVADLREQRIQGLQMFKEFMEQRLASSINSCASVHNTLETLSTRVARVSGLLRTRVDITMEKQTRDLLASMDRRARMQLRLQETVEGLSVVVLSYYLLGIVSYGLKAANAAGWMVNVELATGLAIPFVVGAVFVGLRRLRRRVNKEEHRGAKCS